MRWESEMSTRESGEALAILWRSLVGMDRCILRIPLMRDGRE